MKFKDDIPVTRTTLPERSGISCEVHLGAGGFICAIADKTPPERDVTMA